MATSEPATLKSLATKADLSVATVSKILGGKYKGNTPKGRERIERVNQLASSLGYIANASARRLRGGSHQAILVIVPVDEMGHPGIYTSDYVFGINQILCEAGKSLILHTYARLAVRHLPADRLYDGALVIDIAEDLDYALNAAAIPAMYINSEPAPGRSTFGRDEFQAGFDLIQTISQLGYTRVITIGEIAGGHPSFSQRMAGIRKAITETELTLESLSDPWWHGTLNTTIKRITMTPGTVIVAMDVHSLLQLQRVLQTTVPIACCEDSHLLYELYRDLTRVTFDRIHVGQIAAKALLKRLANPGARPRSTPYRGKVIVGATTPSLYQ